MLANRINRATVSNYRSLGDVMVELSDLTVLVGPNGSGKSNFLDALRFVRDALRQGLDAALLARDRGGIGAVRRYSPKGRPYNVKISINLTLDGQDGYYEFTLSSERRNEYAVRSEECSIGLHRYRIEDSQIKQLTLPELSGLAIQDKNLALPLIGHLPAFKPLYDFLTQMGFYSIFPNSLRSPQRPGNPYPLEEEGDNLATVLRDSSRNWEKLRQDDLYESLARVVPGITTDNPVDVRQVGSYLVVYIKHEEGGNFDLARESDGTIRVLGLLTGLYQAPFLPLIGLEEPELFIHPGAMGVLADVIYEASHRSQVILTTHSPDLISRFSADSLRIVERVDGLTQIGPLREDQRQIIEDRLFGGGDLLRIGGLKRG